MHGRAARGPRMAGRSDTTRSAGAYHEPGAGPAAGPPLYDAVRGRGARPGRRARHGAMGEDRVIRRPVLVAHARYRWDKLRDQHQIVYPEGMIVLNDSAAAIVQLCDGRSADELIAALAAKLRDPIPASELSDDVQGCLRHLVERGLLRDDAE